MGNLALLLCFSLHGKLYSYIEQFSSPAYTVPRGGFNEKLVGGISALSILPSFQGAKENCKLFWVSDSCILCKCHIRIFLHGKKKNRFPFLFKVGFVGFAVRCYKDPQRKVVQNLSCVIQTIGSDEE